MLVKCICTNCAGHLEFEEENAGEKIDCPHCGFETTLFLPGSEQSAKTAPGPWRKRWQKLKARWRLVCATASLLIVVGIGYSLWHWVLPAIKDMLPYSESSVVPVGILIFACLLLMLMLVWLSFPILILLELRHARRALWQIEANLSPALPVFPPLRDEGMDTEKPAAFDAGKLKATAR